MKIRVWLIAGTAVVVLSGAAVAVAGSGGERSNRIDVAGDTFGQFSPGAAVNPDWISIAWQGPDGQTLYVSREGIESADGQALKVIDVDGLILGTMDAVGGLVIDGKQVVKAPPPSTSYLTAP